ncbi:SIMPL domain-containing protein [Rhizorhabdus argentea]|uniref:SIMPL domain-containing protein n=1 Tax=Rhizorhabdus argentea TaxID=1387174 RepID=UPI0030EEADFC
MGDKMRNIGLIAPLALALASPAAAQQEPAGAPMPSAMAGTRLDVVATGEVSVAPDIATVGAGVVTQAATAALAMSDNARRTAATVAAIRKAGVADRDIQTTAINLSPQYRYADNQPPAITGYQASSRVSVRFRDIKAAGPILDSLVAAGANQIDGPALSIDKPEPLLDQAREKAIAGARARAALYARAAGLQVKRIVAISEGSYEGMPRPMPMMMMARGKEAADSSIEAGEQKIAISVSVTFELN